MKKHLFTFMAAIILIAASINVATAAPGSQGGGSVHYVGFGETLVSIADRYGVTIQAIMKHNGIANPDLIYVGQPLIIPTTPYSWAGNMPQSGYGNCSRTHTVVLGETLSNIAYGYGVSLQALLNHNNLYNQDLVYVGQQLCIPGGGNMYPQPGGNYHHGNSPPGSGYHHTVIHGETLHSIADHYQANYLDIMRANNIHNASFIITGQILIIPGYSPPAPVAASAHSYGDKPHYVPPAAPKYDDAQDDYYTKHEKPPYKKEPEPPSYEGVPPAPGYQPGPALPLLPVADHPIQVVVNGGMNWTGEVTADFPDPNGITTLVVSANGLMTPTVRLQSGDYEVKGTIQLEPEFGADMPRFVFRYIPPGDYDVWLEDPEGTPSEKRMPSEIVQVRVNAGQRVYVDFKPGLLFSGPTFTGPDGWFLADWSNPSVPREIRGGWSNILVHTPASGLNVLIESEGGGYQSRCFTGSKGPGACDLAGLTAGFYLIKIEGTGYTVKTWMDGNAYATFTFGRQPVSSDKDKNKVGPVFHD